MLKKILLFLLISCTISIYAQNRQVTGTVLDDANQPLPGVSVVIKNDANATVKGTVTDIDGNFSVEVAPNQTITFSLVGMISQSFVYTGQREINVTMLTNERMLEDVVVIGYQTIRKADLTGAVSVFNPNIMKNATVTGTVGDALGILPGLTVRTSGAPGSEGKVEIRGTGTLGASDPLYVVDGVVSGANRDFNFNDIESIQVLKDASAAAIFGSRAGNGVIIITTKQGKEGKMKIDVSSRLTWQWLPKYNLTGRDRWIELNNLAFANAGKAPANHFDGNTDWQKEVFQTGFVQDQNIALSGGGKDSRYFLSGNYQSNSGTTIGSESERLTFRANTSATRNFGDNFVFKVGENIALSHFRVDELNTNPIVDVYRMLPTISILDPNNAALGGFGFGDSGRDVTFGTNPFAREAFEDTRNSNLRMRGNIFTELEIFKAFKYKFNFGFDFSNDKHHYLRRVGSWTYNQPIDPSSINKNQAQSQGLVFDNTLEYNKAFGKHDIGAVIGTSYQTNTYEQIWGIKNDVLTSEGQYFEQLDAALRNSRTGSFKNIDKIFSIFGRVNYNYDERYLFSFTMRRDESSKFGPDYRTGYFPSVSGAWRLSKENFFNVSWIDDLKVRANYGILGTSNIDVYQYRSVINAFPQVIFGSKQDVYSGMAQVKLINPDLTWERMSQMNAGFDLTMLKNRFQVSFDYFIKETRDVLAPMEILLSTGNNGGNPWVNAVTLDNRGVEIAATWRDKIGKDFQYSLNVNASYLKNKIKKMAYGLDRFTQWDTQSIVGHPIGEWYLIKTDGIFQSEREVLNHKNSKGQVIQPNAKPGDIRYIDYNDDGMITDADRQHSGSTIPKYQLGINMGFEYKGFDLQFLLTGAFGYKIFNGPRSGYDRFDDNSNYRADYDPWTPDNPNAKDPRPIFGDSRNVRGDQDRWLENGNYLRVKQIALGYNLPKSILGNDISQVRVYINAHNLITLTPYTGLDPEFLNSNIWDRSYDSAPFPNPRGFTVGTQITF